jgi:hypothetical protein
MCVNRKRSSFQNANSIWATYLLESADNILLPQMPPCFGKKHEGRNIYRVKSNFERLINGSFYQISALLPYRRFKALANVGLSFGGEGLHFAIV